MQLFIGGVRTNCTFAAGGTDITSFYHQLGVVLRGTPMDGDCGIHTMRVMLQLLSSVASVKVIRVKLHDYLIERIRESWMHGIMLVCQEISTDELEAYRSCGTLHPGHALAAYAVADAPAEDTRLHIYSSREVTEELLEALAWSTGVKKQIEDTEKP